MEIQAVLFDLDNTLFDHQASAREGLGAFMRKLGLELTPGEGLDRLSSCGADTAAPEEPLIDVLFTSEQMGHAKPDSQAFLLPCHSLELPPSQVLYVGDNFRVDVEGARAAGLQALHLDRAGAENAETLRSLTGMLMTSFPGPS